MANNNVSYVSAGKPKVGGAIFIAPLGTTLPTDATTALDAAFENVGYISEDGYTNSNSAETDAIKAWGGDNVYNALTDKPDTFQWAMIEAGNKIVLKTVYGDDNVTGDLENGMTVRANSQEAMERAIVIETVLRGNILKRTVIPRAQLTELGDIVYKDDELVAYETTFSAHPDKAIEYDTHREYLISADAPTDGGDDTPSGDDTPVDPTPTDDTPADDTPDFESMTKAELIAYATENNIEGVNDSMTKAEIIAVIEAALA